MRAAGGARRGVTALLLVLLASACGVPQDDAPRSLDRDTAPFRIFERQVAPPPQGELQAEVWFLRSEQPTPVSRPLEQPGTPRQVLEQLLLGPTQAELSGGLASAIPDSIELVDLTVEQGVAVVTLDELTEQVQVPAYAQIVATLDGRPGIDGVRFRTPAGDVQVPKGDGGLSSGAVTRDDYAVLLGLRPPPAPSPAAGVQPPAPAPDATP